MLRVSSPLQLIEPREWLISFTWSVMIRLFLLLLCANVTFAQSPDYYAISKAVIETDRTLVVFVGIPSQVVGDCEAISVKSLIGYTTGDIVISSATNGHLWWVATVRNVGDVKSYLSTGALTEVNAKRASMGLHPFIHDPGLTQGAQAVAKWRAERHISGHSPNDFGFLPTGCNASSARMCGG